MSNTPTIFTIAFFARGREIGFVVLAHREIVRYGVKTIKGKKQGPDLTRRVERTLAPVLAMAGPHGVIVIERDKARSQRGVLCRAVHHLAKVWRGRGYELYTVSWEEVKRRLCEHHKATQREVIQAVVQRHTLLWPLIRRSAIQAGYWKKVLLAAALGEVVNRQLEQKSLSQWSGHQDRRVRFPESRGTPDGQGQR